MRPGRLCEMKILVVEDSERLRRSLVEGLTRTGFAVDAAADGEEGLEFALAYDHDVIVLDLMLPRMSGLELLERLRDAGRQTHVLILSAKDQVRDRVKGLEIGADDYLIKPFSFDELCARLHALVRRKYSTKSPRISIADLVLDTAGKRVTRGSEQIHLTPSEYSLLEYLCMRRGMVVSQTQLIDHLYDSDSEVGSNVIEVLISGLRKKIHEPEKPPIVKTRRGFGYVVE